MKRGFALGAAALFAMVTATVAHGCSLLTSYEGFTGACGGKIPERPSAPSGGAGEGTTYVGALSRLVFLQEAGMAAPLGYDLDGLCTCPEKAACKNPRGERQPCDLEGTAIDNQAGAVLAKLFQGVQSNAPLGYGVAARLSQYNGAADDSDVLVELYNVVRVTGADGSGPATGDGTDAITVDVGGVSVPANLAARVQSSEAYVTNHTLVARFDAFALRVKTQSPVGGDAIVETPLRFPALVGAIKTTSSGGLEIANGQLVGRMQVTELFTQVSHYGICQDAGEGFKQARDFICFNLDLPASQKDDGKDQQPCDAISIGIGITIKPGKLAPQAAPPAAGTTERCGQEPPVTCN